MRNAPNRVLLASPAAACGSPDSGGGGAASLDGARCVSSADNEACNCASGTVTFDAPLVFVCDK